MSGSKPIPEFVYVYGFLGSSYSLFRKQMAKVTKKLECRICDKKIVQSKLFELQSIPQKKLLIFSKNKQTQKFEFSKFF